MRVKEFLVKGYILPELHLHFFAFMSSNMDVCRAADSRLCVHAGKYEYGYFLELWNTVFTFTNVSKRLCSVFLIFVSIF